MGYDLVRLDDELYHYGVKGMKWGVRRTPEQLGHKPKTSSKKQTTSESGSLVKRISAKRSAKKEEKAKKEAAAASKKKKSISEMSDEELQQHIKRMQLEKNYRDLDAQLHPNRGKGKAFAMRVLEKSGEQLLTQVVNHYGAKAINKAIGQIDKKGLADAQVSYNKKSREYNELGKQVSSAKDKFESASKDSKEYAALKKGYDDVQAQYKAVGDEVRAARVALEVMNEPMEVVFANNKKK